MNFVKDAEPEEEHEINEEGERVPVKRNTGDVWAQRRNEQNASPGNKIRTGSYMSGFSAKFVL